MAWCFRWLILAAAWPAGLTLEFLRERHLIAEGCDQGNVSALLPYEQKLMEDYSDGKSALGRMCFDTSQGAKDLVAQALFILGMKSFSNFQFDYCKHVFDKLTRDKSDFILGYWGRSLCNSQLVWNFEDPVDSAKLLRAGRQKLRQLNSTTGFQLTAKEESYYSAVEALNSYELVHADCPLHGVDPSSDEGLKITRPCRYLAFLHLVQNLTQTYPEDSNAGGFAILANIAVSATNCVGVPLEKCSYTNAARELAHRLTTDTRSKNPAVLHFGLHAHDYPDKEIYVGGFPFAIEYPRYVNGSCHSTHMPSHIWDRAGNFTPAEASNSVSVKAGDFFADSGALKYSGGDVGTMVWTPGAAGWLAGLGFAFDAGNLYHSLEYQQYEQLQLCNFAHARRLTDRMATAAFQAFGAAGAIGEFAADANFAEAWKNSTTYWQFLYRMEARFTLQAVAYELLGDVGEGVPDSGTIGFQLPLPLSWKGIDVYSHEFYSPQSEAGIWAAAAMDRLLRRLGSAKPGNTSPSDEQVWIMSCSDEPLGKMIHCIDSISAMAVKRISMVHQKYLDEHIGYESNLTSAVLAEVKSAASLVVGDLAGALRFAEQARDDEIRAVQFFVSTSTSLYFIPGTAWHGIMCLRLLQGDAAKLPKAPRELLNDAKASFAHCLSPAGRPHLSACLLGAARVEQELWKLQGRTGRSPEAQAFYDQLLTLWGKSRRVKSDPPAADVCDEAWKEAKGLGQKPNPALVMMCGDGTELVGDTCKALQSDNLTLLKIVGVACILAFVAGAGLTWLLQVRMNMHITTDKQSERRPQSHSKSEEEHADRHRWLCSNCCRRRSVRSTAGKHPEEDDVSAIFRE
mmetsp:Transcript_57161/g.99976  ORF Transcript_57161/g.99976 Transcript_57161/m.99976 type:complete len:851 (-) Transcript_57161:116-2668(-)